MIQVVLAQVLGQQSSQKGRLATTLGTNQRGHALVAVVCVQLQPVGHRRAHPDSQEVQLLRADAWQSREEFGHVVLAVPLGQAIQVVLDGIECLHLLRVDVLLDVALRTALLEHVLSLGLNHYAVQRLLRQHAILLHAAVLRPLGELRLSVQHVVSEGVMLVQKHFDAQHISNCLVVFHGRITLVNVFFCHRQKC